MMTKIEVDVLEKLQMQLEALHVEISNLSVNAKDDLLSEFKLKYVNQILLDANKILGVKFKPFSDFSLFDADKIPSNSDVALMLTQYLSCLKRFRMDNLMKQRNLSHNWIG